MGIPGIRDPVHSPVGFHVHEVRTLVNHSNNIGRYERQTLFWPQNFPEIPAGQRECSVDVNITTWYRVYMVMCYSQCPSPGFGIFFLVICLSLRHSTSAPAPCSFSVEAGDDCNEATAFLRSVILWWYKTREKNALLIAGSFRSLNYTWHSLYRNVIEPNDMAVFISVVYDSKHSVDKSTRLSA